jgi:hypothetical protein
MSNANSIIIALDGCGIDGKGSKRNKYGVQAGYKYINTFANLNLDLQLEFQFRQALYPFREKTRLSIHGNWRTPLTPSSLSKFPGWGSFATNLY